MICRKKWTFLEEFLSKCPKRNGLSGEMDLSRGKIYQNVQSRIICRKVSVSSIIHVLKFQNNSQNKINGIGIFLEEKSR